MALSVSPREGKEISASHLELREGTASVPYINPLFLLCCIVSAARPTQDFLRGPDRTKGTLVLCSCPGVDLAKPVKGWSQCLLRRGKVVASGNLNSG